MSRVSQKFGELRALAQLPPDRERWWQLLLMLRAWPDSNHRREVAAPYVRDVVRRWPVDWLGVEMGQLLACDERVDAELLARWRPGANAALPVVAEDSEWLREVLRHASLAWRERPELTDSLVRGGAFRKLRSLDLRSYERPAALVEIVDTLFDELEVELEALSLFRCFLNGDAAVRLLDQPQCARLERLALRESLKTSAVDYLRSFEHLESVRWLELYGDLLRSEDLEALLGAPLFEGLRGLTVGWMIDARGDAFDRLAFELSEHLSRTSLQALALPGVQLSARAAAHFVGAAWAPGVRYLDLSGSSVSREALALFFDDASRFSDVTHLRVGSWVFGEEDFGRLARSPLSGSLTHLEVTGARLGHLLPSMLDGDRFESLESLSVDRCRLDAALGARLAQTPPPPKLRELVIRDAEEVRGDFFDALQDWSATSSLERLYVTSGRVSAVAIDAARRAFDHDRISLHVSRGEARFPHRFPAPHTLKR